VHWRHIPANKSLGILVTVDTPEFGLINDEFYGFPKRFVREISAPISDRVDAYRLKGLQRRVETGSPGSKASFQ
jgi:hypothetical protein